ncbi:MAG: tetratricopeptide repeat protein [Planctomycetota bacterium]|nr:tetratricopeptide repeat protein [Planctomycetota bacterium]
MSIRPKTKRRLVLLLCSVGLLAVLGVVAVLARGWQLERRAKVFRAAGMAAAQREDWPAAQENLRHYLAPRRNADDVEALFQYARACRKVQMPESKHLVAAIQQLRRLIALKPDHLEAQEMAVEIYTELGASTEAAAAADRLLAQRPDDPVALRAKAIALTRLRRNADALAATEAYLKVKPEDLQVHLLNLDLMQRVEKPAAEIVARAEALHKSHPDDPRFELLLACAYRAANDPRKSNQWLRTAAGHKPPDADFLQILVGLLDNSGMFTEARAVLEKSAGPDAGPQVLTALAFRLWENGQDKELIERFAKLDLDNALTAADLMGLKAMSLARTGKVADAKPLADALRQRVSEMRAQAWSTFLDGIILVNTPSPREIADVCRKAIALESRISPLHAMAGQAYFELGEKEQSLREWQEASRLSPSWSLPLSRMARLLSDMNRPELAVVAAREAGLRAPGNAEAAVVWVTSRYANLTNNPNDSPDKVLSMIDDVQKAMPGEPQTLALKVELLVQTGKKDAAANAVRQALAANPAPAPETLMRLAEVSREAGLGQEEACLQLYEKASGPTPESVLFRALGFSAKGQFDQGRKLIDASTQGEKEAAKLLRWKLALAEYLDRNAAPDAVEVIGALADAEPRNLAVQQSVMRSRTAGNDRKLMDRTIDHVKALTGDDAAGWRVARARWLLQGDQAATDTPKALALLQEVVRTAPELLDGRLLLARTYERQGNRTAALEELKAARNLAPRSNGVALDLAAMLQAQGDLEGSSALIDAVLKSPAAGPEELRRAATLLAARGQGDRAIEVLKNLEGGAGADAQGSSGLLLAMLYRSRNQFDAAEAAARKAIAQNPDAQAIEFLADLLGSRGKDPEAQKVLAMLDKPGPGGEGVGPEVRELALGRYARNRGREEEAAEHFRKAVAAAPANGTAWRFHLATLARRGKTAELSSAADQAAKSAPGDAALLAMQAQAKLAARLGAEIPELLRPLVAAVVEHPDRQSQAADALRVAVEGIEQSTPGDQVLSRLSPISDRSGGFAALQLLMVRMHIALRHWEEAANLAARAMQASPGSTEAASLATQAYSGSARWSEALAAAQKWRALAFDQPRSADLVIGDLSLRTSQPDQALRAVEPYIKAARENPEENAMVIAIHVQALSAKGRTADAVGELTPLLAKSARCRAIWMEMAASSRDAATGSKWLEQVAAAIPENLVDERVNLAQTWMRLGERLNNASLAKTGRSQLEQLVQRPDATAFAVVTLALLTDAMGDLAQSEALYRRALSLDKTLDVARNNLAMVLIRRPGDKTPAMLTEAQALAAEAVKNAPGNSDYRDTLAAVELQAKNYDKAAAAQREAVRLSPENPVFRLTLAQILQAGGKTKEAASALSDLDALAGRGVTLPEQYRAQLDALRKATQGKPSGSAAAGSN